MLKKFITILCIVCINLFAALPFQLEEISNGYRIHVKIPPIQVKEITVTDQLSNGAPIHETFINTFIPYCTVEGEYGDPEHHVLSFKFALGDCTPKVEVSNVIEETIFLQHKLYPVQIPLTYCGCDNDEPEFFSYNPDAYKVKRVRAPYTSVLEEYTFRGQKAATIRIQPDAYDPVTNSLRVVTSMTLTVIVEKPLYVRSWGSKVFDKVMREIYTNLDASVPSERFRSAEKYLILSNPSFKENADLKRLIDFRNENGCEVEIVSTSDVGGSDKDAFRTFIRDKQPTYVLLVGTNPDFPHHLAGSIKSYTYYVSPTTTDPKPDIALGLFYVADDTDLKNIVDKTIITEQNVAAMPMIYVGHGGNTKQMGQLAPEHCDEVVKEIYDTYFLQQEYEYIPIYSVLTPKGGSKEDIAACNKGVRFIHYNGHGNNTGWGFGWSSNHLSQLTNTIYPFILSCACNTGTFDKSNCMSVEFSTHKNGPCTFIGSYNTSGMGQHVLSKGLYDGIIAKKITKYGPAFVYAQNCDYKTMNPEATSNSSVSARSMQQMINQYHLFGDPAVETMSSAPSIFVSLPNGGEEVEKNCTYNLTWSDNIDGNVKIELLKAGNVVSEIASSTESDGLFEWDVPGNLTVGSDYKIKIICIDSAALIDESNGNFSIIEEYIITSFPFIEDFEKLDTGMIVLPKKWAQASDDDFNWLVLSGPTPSKQYESTGPDGDHTSGSGKYVYMEASSPNSPNKKANIFTPKFGLKNMVSPELTFYYHMFSDSNHMGDLVLDIEVDGKMNSDIVKLTDNAGDVWKEQKVDLTSFKGERVIFHFRGVTGQSWCSDICIDDFGIIETGTPIINALVRIPVRFDLHYTGSRIHFQVPQNGKNSSHVRLKLFNVQGKLIRTLVNGNLKAGYHSLFLDKISGRGIAVGAYLCRLESGDFTKTIKILFR